jgi:hypothetical protein
LKTRGPTRRPFTSGLCVSRLEFGGHTASGGRMKKLMLVVIVLALGALVAKKKMAA